MDEDRSAYTVRTLLEELKRKIPQFEKGQIFETIKSIYPSSEVAKEKKNIKLEGRMLTKPLALCRKDKSILIKDQSDLVSFFKNLSRGDFLMVSEIENGCAKCDNLSLNEETIKKYYKDEKVTLTLEDLASGTVRLYRRKISKFVGNGNG